jgi:hypothetical protein
MNHTIERAGWDQRRAGLATAWVLLTTVLTLASGLFGGPSAGATGLGIGPAPSHLPAVQLTLSTTAAGATDVTYLIEFTMPISESYHLWVKVETEGPLLPTCGHITDLFTGDSSDACAPTSTQGSRPSNVMIINTPSVKVHRLDAVAVEFEGVTNGVTNSRGITIANSGLQTLHVWVSSSQTSLARGLVGSTEYRFTKMNNLTGLSVAMSSYAVGASELTYGVTFKTSATGGLAPEGTITVKAPPNVVLPTCGHVTDLSTGANSDACAPTSTQSAQPTNKMTITMGGSTAIGPGDEVWVEFTGVSYKQTSGFQAEFVNSGPAASSVEVQTSSDGPTTASYNLLPAKPVSNVYVQLSRRNVGATDVTYAIFFQTSTDGGLAPAGSITVAVEGAVFPTTCAEVTDLANEDSSNACDTSNGAVPSQTMTVSTTTIDIAAGDEVEVVFTGVKNPSGVGSHYLTVSTSSDRRNNTTFSLFA